MSRYLVLVILWVFPAAVRSADPPPGWIRLEDDPSIVVPVYCRGGFAAEPAQASKDSVRIRAGQATREENLLRLQNDIEIAVEGLLLRGEKALYYEDEGRVEFIGPARVDSPDLMAETEGIFYRDREDELILRRTRFSLPGLHAWGETERLYKQRNKMELEGARFSFCDPSEESWHLRARRLDLNLATMQGSGRNVRLYGGSIPILYLPYVAFPIGGQRQSGLLYPYFSLEKMDGFTYSQPVYFNLAPQSDATSYFHLIQRRGFLWEQEFRWLTPFGAGILGTGYLPYDERRGAARDATHLLFTSSLRRGWMGDLLFTRVSDEDYLTDLPHFFDVQDEFVVPRRARIRYAAPRVEWELGLRDYQPLTDQPVGFYNQIPHTRLSLFSPVWMGAYLYDIAEYILFEGEEMTPNVFYYEGNNGRFHNLLALGWEGHGPGGFVHMEWNMHHSEYDVADADPSSDADPSLAAQTFFADGGLEFSRFLTGGFCPCFFVVQPRLYALSVNSPPQDSLPVFDTESIRPGYDGLFSPSPFSGNDRVADAERLSAGLESRILNLQGEEIYRFRLGRAAYGDSHGILLFNETVADEERSPWMADLLWRLGGSGYVEWNLAHDEEQAVQQGAAFKYKGAKKTGFSLFYYENLLANPPARRRQIGGNTALRLGPGWSVFGELRYDLRDESTPLGLSGLSYENCCLRTDFGIYEKRTEQGGESGIVLQFFLKPLGGGEIGHNELGIRIRDIYDNYAHPY